MRSRQWLILGLLSMALFSVSGCAEAQKDKAASQVTVPIAQDYEPAMFSEKMKEKGAVILDVRTPAEVAEGKIPGAVVIDWNSASFREEVAKLDRKAPVYVYCAAGGRSSEAKELMTGMGFTQVHDLLGGMNAWRAAGKPVEGNRR